MKGVGGPYTGSSKRRHAIGSPNDMSAHSDGRPESERSFASMARKNFKPSDGLKNAIRMQTNVSRISIVSSGLRGALPKKNLIRCHEVLHAKSCEQRSTRRVRSANTPQGRAELVLRTAAGGVRRADRE